MDESTVVCLFVSYKLFDFNFELALLKWVDGVKLTCS